MARGTMGAAQNLGQLILSVDFDASKADAELDRMFGRVKQTGEQIEQTFNRAGGRATRQLSFGLQQVGFQINDIVVGLTSGQRPMTVLIQQGTQLAQVGALLAGSFNPVVGIITALTTAAVAAGVAFFNMRSGSDEAANALDELNIQIDKVITSVGDAAEQYVKLTLAQRQNIELNLTAQYQNLQDEQDTLIEQLDELVTEFGQLGAAMAGIEETGQLSNLIAQFLSGTIGATEFAAGLAELGGTIDNQQFGEFVEQVRELANQLLRAELGAQETANRLKALVNIAQGLVTPEGRNPLFPGERRGAGARPQLTEQQRRLQQAGAFLPGTIGAAAEREAFAREQESLALGARRAGIEAEDAAEIETNNALMRERAAIFEAQEQALTGVAQGLASLGETAAFEGLDAAAQQFLRTLTQLVFQAVALSLIFGAAGAFGFGTGGVGGGAGALAGAQGGLGQLPLFGALFRQHGGPVAAGQAYFVGEAGRELFVPGQGGTIIPNHGLAPFIGGVNIDARGAKAGVGGEIDRALNRFSQMLGPMLDERERRGLGGRRRGR